MIDLVVSFLKNCEIDLIIERPNYLYKKKSMNLTGSYSYHSIDSIVLHTYVFYTNPVNFVENKKLNPNKDLS